MFWQLNVIQLNFLMKKETHNTTINKVKLCKQKYFCQTRFRNCVRIFIGSHHFFSCLKDFFAETMFGGIKICNRLLVSQVP